jgi:hypothetical protein
MKYQNKLARINFRDMGITIETENHEHEDNLGGAAKLFWTDYVANDWEEEFSTVSEALGRLALLRACEESGFEKYFVNSPETFQKNFKAFLDSELSDTYGNTLEIVKALNNSEPRYSWELIPTGGGCHAITATEETGVFHIFITDGDGQAPVTISQNAKAIFEKCENGRVNEIHQTDFMRLDHLLPLISEKITELNEASKIEDLLASLAELADFLAENRIPQFSDNEREKYSEDIAEAVHLITMSEKEL